MIPWAIDDLIISDDVLWQSALKDAHGLPQVSAQLAERFGRWPAFSGLARPGRRLNLVTLWNHSTSVLRAAAKRQFEQYASPEREVIRRLMAVDCVVPGVSPSSVLLALGPWDVARSGSTYAPRNLLDDADVATVSGGVIWRPGRFGQAIQIAEATTNLFINPSIEIDTTGFTSNGGTQTRVTTQAYVGSASLRSQGTANGHGWYSIVTAITSAGIQYTFSVWMKGTGTVLIGWGGTVSGEVNSSNYVLTDSWTRYSITFTYAAGDAARYLLVYQSGAGTSNFYCDAIQLEAKGYATPYCDGSCGPNHSWSGTAYASASSRTAASCKFTNPISSAAGTLSLWWKPSADNTGPTQYFFSDGSLIAFFDSANNIIYLTDGTNTIYTAVLTFSAEIWMHLAFTWSSSGLVIYRNGISVATSPTYTAPTAGSYLYLGTTAILDTHVGGLLDQVLVLGVALTAAQVSTLYTAQLAADWKARWCNVIAEEVKAFAIAGEETDQGVVSTLAVDGDVRWRSRDGAQFWRVITDTGSFVVNNDGDDDAYPIFYITPKTAKTGNVWNYKRWIPVKWLAATAATNYPWTFANEGFDTATLVTASKCKADGDDLRVKVNGVEVNRWLAGMNTATTKIWVNLDFQASQVATMAAIGDTTSTTLTATTDITNWPSTGILYIDTEAITYTGKSNADKTFTGCTRGAKGTTAATHAAAATAYWIQHDIWILYGNASASAPTVDDNYKPAFELDHSTNTSWVYEAFGEDDGLRSASWSYSTSGGYGGGASRTTGNHGGASNPWSDLGMSMPDSNIAHNYIYNPCGITNANFTNGEYNLPAGTVTAAAALRVESYSGGYWNIEATIAYTADGTWRAWSDNEAIASGVQSVGFGLYFYTTSGIGYAECADCTITLDSNYTPVVVIGAEQSSYDLAVTLTNSATGDSVVIALTMQLNQTLEIDTDAKTITLLADNSQQMQALTLTGGARRDWLRLAAGNNTLTWSDTGTVSVEVEILFDRRYYE